jgi:hypothetical protein
MPKEKKPQTTTEAQSQNQPQHHSSGFSPVDKLRLLSAAAADSDLSRAELASLIVIANGVNSKTGVTWRSSNTLARETASTSRTAKRAVKKLVEKRYVKIVKRGDRSGKANTYSLGSIFGLIGGAFRDTTIANSLVMAVTTSSDNDETYVVSVASPLSMTLSESKARIERNRSSGGDALPCGVAGASSGKRQPNGDLYPDFWNTFPFRAGVAVAEEVLGKFIKDGIEYEAILAGAKRYAEYCKRSKIRTSADAWLKRQSWRDEWTPYKDKEESRDIQKNGKKDQKIQKRRMRVPSDEYRRWKGDLGRLNYELSRVKECWNDHYGLGTSQRPIGCSTCFEFVWNKLGSYCVDGAKLKSAQLDVEALIKAHINSQPDKGLHYKD